MTAHLLFGGLGLGGRCGRRSSGGSPVGSRRRRADHDVASRPTHGQVGLHLLGQLGIALGLLGLLLLLLLLFGHAALGRIDVLEAIVIGRQFAHAKLCPDRRGLFGHAELGRTSTRGGFAEEELSGARGGGARATAGGRAVHFQPTARGRSHIESARVGVAGGQFGRRAENAGGPAIPRRRDGPLGLVGLILLHGIVEVVEEAAATARGRAGTVVPFHELAALPCLGIDQLLQLDAVGLGGLGVVLLVRLLVHVRQSVLAKKRAGIAIAADPHGIDLPLRPLVEVDAPDEGEVDAHRAVGGAAIQAQEHPVGHRGPRRAGVGTVEADLVVPYVFEFPELRVLFGRRDAHLPLAGGRDHPILSDVAGLAGVGRIGGGTRSGGRHDAIVLAEE